MRNLLIIFFLAFFSISINAQTVYPTLESKSFTWTDGYNKPAEVDFIYSPDEKKYEEDFIKDIVGRSMIEAHFSLRNPLSFVPKNLVIISGFKGEGLIGVVTMYAKNDYGVESRESVSVVFDDEGTFKKVVNL